MLKERQIGIEMYMIHDEIDLTHLGYSPDADIVVSTYTECNTLFRKNNQETYTGVRIEFITNKTNGIKRTETHKWWGGRYLGSKREYIKKKNI